MTITRRASARAPDLVPAGARCLLRATAGPDAAPPHRPESKQAALFAVVAVPGGALPQPLSWWRERLHGALERPAKPHGLAHLRAANHLGQARSGRVLECPGRMVLFCSGC
jgi:hypothetical protein